MLPLIVFSLSNILSLHLFNALFRSAQKQEQMFHAGKAVPAITLNKESPFLRLLPPFPRHHTHNQLLAATGSFS